MTEPQIICPKCKSEIKLTESLAAPLIAKTRKHFQQQLADKQAEFAVRETALRKSQAALAKARAGIEDELAQRMLVERAAIAESEARKARLTLAADLKRRDRELLELQQTLNTNNAKLEDAQKAQMDVLRKARELDDARRELDLSVEQRVQSSLHQVRSEAKAEAEHGLKAKVSEKEAQIAGMQRQIEELRRKADQGSQQLQGESLEHELETLLRTRFPRDRIDPVAVAAAGGDILHLVRGPTGKPCGSLIWEAKRTKTWHDRWLAKLRNDQRNAKADIALIVTNILPKGIETFDLVDGVWVTKLRYAIPLAIALRQSLIDIASNRQATEGQQTKIDQVYQYLTGARFRHHSRPSSKSSPR